MRARSSLECGLRLAAVFCRRWWERWAEGAPRFDRCGRSEGCRRRVMGNFLALPVRKEVCWRQEKLERGQEKYRGDGGEVVSKLSRCARGVAGVGGRLC